MRVVSLKKKMNFAIPGLPKTTKMNLTIRVRSRRRVLVVPQTHLGFLGQTLLTSSNIGSVW